MKKLVLLFSFVFALGLITVNAQDAPKKVIKRAPAKTEAAKPAASRPAGRRRRPWSLRPPTRARSPWSAGRRARGR